MNKGTVIRAGIIFGLFVIILGISWIASGVKDKNDVQALSNPEEAYLTVGDYTITRDDLWNKMKADDGVSYLTQYIEATYFYADEIANVTEAEIDEKIEFYTYGTNDADDLAEIFADAELKADLEEQFEKGLLIINFDPTSDVDLRRFVELEIAKEKATKAYALAADEENDLYITDEDLQDYYEDDVVGDVCAVNIKFNSAQEARNYFNENNLVSNYNLGWGRYTGTEDITTLSTGDFDSDNTTQLTDEEVFDEYIKMYNYMNPNATIAVDTLANFETTCNDALVYNYKGMTEDYDLGDPYTTLANYMFNTLDIEDENSRYSFNLQELGEFQMLSFKISQEDVPAFDTLSDTELADLEQEILDSYINTTIVTRVNETYWDAAEFEIFDPTLKIKYFQQNGTEFDNSGSKTKIASIDGNDITADQLYDYMIDKIGTYYTIDMVQTEMLLNSETFTTMFGTNTDYIDSDNEKATEYRDELRGMKTAFAQGAYVQYGFDNSIYTWEEFILLAFGANNENEAIQNLFILSDLQPYLSVDLIDYAAAAALIQEKVDNYFSLNVVHLLVYTDFDNDLSPDEYNDYVSGLTGDDLTEYNTLKAELEALIEDRIEDDMVFADIVEEYQDSLLGDPENDWADAKAYGFHIMTQDLSSQASLSPDTTASYDEDFVVAVKNLYDEYVVVVDTSATDVEDMYDDELIQSNFGLHYLYATEGDAFDIPTAVYAESDDLDSEFDVEANGTTIIPNADQMALYIEIENAEKLGKATTVVLPTSVFEACEAYFATTYNAYFSSAAYSIAAAQFIVDNNPTYAANTADNVSYLNDVIDIMYESGFPEGFTVPE